MPISIADDPFNKILITLWHIWKVRNDNRFQRRTWTPSQVHHAVLAYINTTALATLPLDDPPDLQSPSPVPTNQQPALHQTTTDGADATTTTPQGMMPQIAGTTHTPPTCTLDHSAVAMNRLTVLSPGLLPGIRCYVDASITLDSQPTNIRKAGIGIFFVNPQVQPVQTIHIAAQLSQAHSVLTAEAAALALAAIIADRLDYNNVTFLSNCQRLVQFLSSADLTNPPEWQIKQYTQVYTNSTGTRQARISNISRALNVTADTLARQAFRANVPSIQNLSHTCSYMTHSPQCPLLQALSNVRINHVILLAASCCSNE
jgi:hypothetical protein